MRFAFATGNIPKRAIAATLALVAAASIVAGRERPALEVVQPEPRRAAAEARADLDVAKLEHRAAAAPQTDPFAPRSFAPPPPVKEAPGPAARPAAPTAPPLPFVYVGRVTANGKTDVYVMRGEELIDVVAGAKIDQEYRVDAISETSIIFTYLPLQMRQSLELAEGEG